MAILKRLLDDPSYSTEVKEEGERVIQMPREYDVRRAASESLKKLGIPFPKPILRVPLPQKTGEKEKPKSPTGA